MGANIPASVLEKMRAARTAAGAAGPAAPGGRCAAVRAARAVPAVRPGGFQERVTAQSADSQQRQRDFTPPPELLAALLPLRSVAACAYGTVLTTTEAKAKGYDVQPGVQVARRRRLPAPAGTAVAAAPSPAPGASPAPSGQPRPERRPRRGGGFGGNAFYYAPTIGLFVVRPPDLGTGGGSVKQ